MPPQSLSTWTFAPIIPLTPLLLRLNGGERVLDSIQLNGQTRSKWGSTAPERHRDHVALILTPAKGQVKWTKGTFVSFSFGDFWPCGMQSSSRSSFGLHKGGVVRYPMSCGPLDVVCPGQPDRGPLCLANQPVQWVQDVRSLRGPLRHAVSSWAQETTQLYIWSVCRVRFSI